MRFDDKQISKQYLCDLKHGRRTTFLIDVAKYVASKTGKPPITYLNKKIREEFGKLYPSLKKNQNND